MKIISSQATIIFMLCSFIFILGCDLESGMTDFESCAAAGNPIMESYPRKCAADGMVFVEDIDPSIVMPPGPDEVIVEDAGEVMESQPVEPKPIGGDRDEHGCIGSAGYTWCEEKQKCLRTWEEPCPNGLPEGYNIANYTVAEVTNQTCKKDTDCSLPFDYAIRSNCPYMPLCIEEKCAVICPEYNPKPNIPEQPDNEDNSSSDPLTDPAETDPYACSIDSDCVVKDVHNCCGYYPRCVNKDFEPDIEAVQKGCQEQGLASVCGWPDITECRCDEGRCISMQDGQIV